MDTGEWLEYAEFYPDEDEPGFDGVHYGGVKGMKKDAPEWAVKVYERHKTLKEQGILL